MVKIIAFSAWIFWKENLDTSYPLEAPLFSLQWTGWAMESCLTCKATESVKAHQQGGCLFCVHLEVGAVSANTELRTHDRLDFSTHLNIPLHHCKLLHTSLSFHTCSSWTSSISLQFHARPLDFCPTSVPQHTTLLITCSFTVLQVISPIQRDSAITQPTSHHRSPVTQLPSISTS